ncbi:MAG: menaquinone-dependent protoporphyrinogen IX dehydrogenase [Gammaproteobacteria bacterium]|nr:menaquinone-dependent protoporphyrinogen IX dehydrogenase [Gammaproteobacteria bacterium]
MEKSLITYSTVDGQTKIISEKIAQFATQSSVDIFPISDNIELGKYKTIIIGASIRYGKYRKEVYSFVEKNIEILNSKENAFFSVNVVARKPEKNTPETNPYLIKFLKKIKWNPKNLGVFAGKIEYPKYKFVDKYAIKFIMWITKGPTDTTKTYEFTDWKKVESFTKNLNL